MKTLHENEHTTVLSVDGPDHANGGACHIYNISTFNGAALCGIRFQQGPIGEPDSVNGIEHLDLLQIIQHRLQGFQRGEFACTENAVTLGFVKAAIDIDNQRAAARVAGLPDWTD